MPEPGEVLLLIEDDLQTRRILHSGLARHGWRILEAATGQEGLALAGMESPDLVVLDLGLPDLDGVSLVRSFRRYSDTPVLILSARSHERDKIEALDSGADDYLAKPFSMGELEARVRALLRRRSRVSGEDRLACIGSLSVNLTTRQVCRDGEEVRLTPIEYRLLAMLVRHSGLVLTHRQLLREVWGPDHVEDVHYLRIYMGQLRHKLESDPARPRHLLTEVGVGYRLAGHE